MSILKKNYSRQACLWASALGLSLGIAACNGGEETITETPGVSPTEEEAAQAPPTEPEGVPAPEDLEVQLSGAGASFPAPLYQTWFRQIQDEYPGLQVAYQSVGSGAGVRQYIEGTVDFGATDAPLTEEERQQFEQQYGEDPIQLPMTGGLIVFGYNLPGVEDLQLSREAYCGIVTGEIDQWDAPAIQEANPDTELPSQPIEFVHRSDGSGTTFLFTNHLTEACPNWQAGAAKTVSWPTGTGARGNEGVAATIQQTEGAIGYVEFTFAEETGIPMATIENQAGNFVEPSPEAAAGALEGVEVPQDFGLLVPDPSGEQAYPIVGLTFLLVYPEYESNEEAEAVEATVDWALQQGDEYALELGYIPLPEDLQQRVMQTLEEEVQRAGNNNSSFQVGLSLK